MSRVESNRRTAETQQNRPAGQKNAADRFLEQAMKFRGQRYLWGGGHGGTFSAPGPVDCSGLIQQAARMTGTNLDGTAAAQQDKGRAVSMSDLRPGDLVFKGNPAHHVGIYIGNGQVLHAPHTGDVVRITTVSYFDNARRVFDDAGAAIETAGLPTDPPATAGSSSGGGSSGGGSAGGGASGGDSSGVSGGSRPSSLQLQANENMRQLGEDLAKREDEIRNRGKGVHSGMGNVNSSNPGNFMGLQNKLGNAGVSAEMLQGLSQQYGVPLELILAVIQQESGGDPNAQSPAGAQGLMQLMPDTARALGVQNPMDAKANVEGGVKYLAQLLKQFDGDTRLALAAYNAGPGNVEKYNGVPPFAETQNYVTKIMASMSDGGQNA